MTTKLHPLTVVITGASAGIGRATARAFAREGAHMALLARGRDGLEAAKREVEELGGKAVVHEVDVADAAAVDRVADRIELELGHIDVWVNNAMVSVFSRVRDMTADDYHRVTAVTYLGVVHGTLAALRVMRPRNRGVIIQVGSALAYRGIPLQSAYCAAKHAIQGFMDSLRCELLNEKSGIRACMVQMPALNTPQFTWVKSHLPRKAQPVPPIFHPDVAARAIVYAAHHPRREYKVGFPTLKSVFANRIAPDFADHYLAKNGFDAQQTDEPEDPERPDNLYSPLPGDHGVLGRAEFPTRGFSATWWIDKHRRSLVAVLAAGLAGAAWVFAGRRG